MILRLALAIMLIPSICFGANYYVDSEAAAGGDGSYATPWNSVSQVMSYSYFNSGDDLYFKVGSVFYPEITLSIAWTGTAENRVIIGAYHMVGGSPVHNLGGNARPIFDGQETYPALDYGALVQVWGNFSYVTIENLEVRNSYASGIQVGRPYTTEYSSTTSNSVLNCIITNTGRQGITLARTHHALAANNVVSQTSRRRIEVQGGYIRPAGAAIEVAALGSELNSHYNVVRDNIVSECRECIGVYNGPRWTTITGNTVYNARWVGVYIERSRDVIIENNLLYSWYDTDYYTPAQYRRGSGIWLTVEGNVIRPPNVIANVTIRNNYIAGQDYGIRFGTSGDSVGAYHNGHRVYNNRLIDNTYNIFSQGVGSVYWDNNEVTDNYSFIESDESGLAHVSPMTINGFTWSGNYYNTPPTVTGDAATGARFNRVALQNTSIDWRDLSSLSGLLTREHFAITGEVVQTCADNPALCDQSGCTTSHPTYFWCPDESGCQPIPCYDDDTSSYYVDPDAADGGDGSYATPWNSIAQVSAANFTEGSDVYFKVGTTLNMTEPLTIDWSGTESDRVIIGAYYGDGLFGLNGGERPILSGQDWTVPEQGSYSGLVQHQNRAGYVTIENLEIKRSGGAGIKLGNSYSSTGYPYKDTYHVIRNCYINNSWRQGITVARASHNLIEDNILLEPSYGEGRDTINRIKGAGIEITGMNNEEVTQYNVVRGNNVSRGNEGIGVYQRARYTTVENNIVYDCGTYNIYMDKVRNVTVSGNLVYATPNSRRGANVGWGIVVVAELSQYVYEAPFGYADVYNNYIAGLDNGVGIYVSSLSTVTVGPKGMRYYNNRIVDCIYNYRFIRDTVGDWEDNQIDDSYSYVFTSSYVHTSKMSPVGFTWSGNTYNTDIATVTDNAATTATLAANASLGTSALAKTTGWRSLTAGAVTRDDFLFVDEAAPDCTDDYELCDNETDCLTNYPTYYWCPAESGCQTTDCYEDPLFTCANRYSLCTAENCASTWPGYQFVNGSCQWSPTPVTEPLPFSDGIRVPLSDYGIFVPMTGTWPEYVAP